MTLAELKAKLNNEGGNLSGVYKITRKADGKVYIGQSVRITERILQHINNIHENDSEKIDGAIQKDGWEAFDYEVVIALPELNAEQLWLAESANIARYDSYNNGFNKTQGNHIGKFNHADFSKKHVVSVDIIKFIRDTYRLSFEKKSVLIINLFDQKFIDKLKFDDCIVYYISKYSDNKTELYNYIMEELERLNGEKFDLVIANPPYGKDGANIAKKIIDTIDFNEYINLLPANDYRRNNTHDLYQYVDLDSMYPVNSGFEDAAVTTHVARITKKKHTYISWDEFEIENYTDNILKKYFYENRNGGRKDFVEIYKPTFEEFADIKVEESIYIPKRLVANKHFAYDINCLPNQYNLNKITKDFVIANSAKSEQKLGNVGDFYLIKCSSTEKLYLTDFIYSADGFRFMSKILTAVNADSAVSCNKYLPKVDWTHAWTVEEILDNYGYTPAEIQAVMDDLHATNPDGTPKYKGIED